MARKYERKTESDERRDISWNQPPARSMPVFHHECVCEFCGRVFVLDSLSPLKPRFCLSNDPASCIKRRRAAYMKEYRSAKKGKVTD